MWCLVPAVIVPCPFAAVETPSVAAERVARVEVTLVGDAASTETTQTVVEELLGAEFELDVRTVRTLELTEVVTPGPHHPDLVARVWIDMSGAQRATIYIVDGPWERIMIRHVPTPEGYGEISREQVGHITRGSVEALSAGARIGIERQQVARELGVAPSPPPSPPPPPEPTAAPPPDPAPPPTELAAWLAVSYDAAAFASAPVVTHGPTLSALIELRRRAIRPAVGASVHYGLPHRVSTPDVSLRLDTVGLRGRFALGPQVAPHLALRPWLGAGIDLMRVDARARTPQTEPFPPFWKPIPIFEVGFGVGIQLGAALELQAALAAEVDPVDTTYRFVDSGVPVFDPWLVRGMLRLGVAFDPLHMHRRANKSM